MISHKTKILMLCSAAFAVGAALPAAAQEQPAASTPNAASDDSTDIVVTAQKRDERLLDTPVPVAVVNTGALTQSNQVLIRDFSATVPGFSISPSIQSQQTLSIRGVTTGIGNPTVGVVVDDVPFGASTNNGGARTVPDIDPSDLERIEVLRGPQGTIYGANSMGGLLKFVTREPSFDRFSGSAQAGINAVEDGGIGFNGRLAVNVPLGDKAAMRASGFYRRDAGYIDNVLTGQNDINRSDSVGGRVSLRVEPTDTISITLNALAQRIQGDGATSEDPALGERRQSRARDTGWYDRSAQAYSATLRADLGGADLTSITGYNVNYYADSFDFGFSLGASAQANFGVPGASLDSVSRTKKFSQEVRLSSSEGSNFEWLLGGFYSYEDSFYLDNRYALTPATGARAGRLSFTTFPTTYEEVAAFLNLTYHFTDRFDIQLGARQSSIRQSFEQTSINTAGVTSTLPKIRSQSSPFTYLITPRFKISENAMLYARFASGYRAGGPNSNSGGVVPAQYDPDQTRNYEVGFKGQLFDRMLTVDASLYDIEWKDIQLTLVSPLNFAYMVNGSSARSRGAEFSAELRPTSSLTISGWVAYNEAELRENLPAGGTAFGVRGDRLPISPRWSGYLSAEQRFPLGRDLTGYVGGSLTYVGDRVGPFRAVAARELLPDYTQFDLRAGVRNERWSANLFATNLADSHGKLYGGLGGLPPTAYAYIQPRTIGLQLGYNF